MGLAARSGSRVTTGLGSGRNSSAGVPPSAAITASGRVWSAGAGAVTVSTVGVNRVRSLSVATKEGPVGSFPPGTDPDEYDRLRRRVLWTMPSGLYVVGSRSGGRRNA